MTPQAPKRPREANYASGAITDADKELLELVLLENARGTDLYGTLRTRAFRLCRLGYLATTRVYGCFRLTRRGLFVAAGKTP